jgi:hypothetical protein
MGDLLNVGQIRTAHGYSPSRAFGNDHQLVAHLANDRIPELPRRTHDWEENTSAEHPRG